MIGAGRLSLIVHGIRDASSCVEFYPLTPVGTFMCHNINPDHTVKERWFGELGTIGSKF